jgi:hypothetical protein
LESLKGQEHEIFGPRFFSSINTPGPPDSWAKAVSNVNSYSKRYSIFSLRYPKNFLFYFADNRKGRSLMDGFLLDCCFNSGYEGLTKFRELTPRYAKSTPHYVT